MEIKFANQVQTMIADRMWQAKDMNEVRDLLRIFGKDGDIVYNMILAHTMDEVMDTDDVGDVLDKIFHR